LKIKWRNIAFLLVLLGIVGGGSALLLAERSALDSIPGVSEAIAKLSGKGGASTPTPFLGTMTVPMDEPVVVEGVSWFATPAVAATPTPKPAIRITAPKEATVNADTLNMRGGPSTEYPIVDTAKRGDKLEIMGRSRAGDWFKVTSHNGQEAWVYARLVTTDVPIDDIAVVIVFSTPPASVK
jgi:uncharacterized protein YgiM (DUF1202 family)